MLKIKLTVILIVGLIAFKLLADPTILGFEETLQDSEKKRLEEFIKNHKATGKQKCYYHPGENTVVCEDSEGIIYPFK
jgi:hypothetical protein